MVTANHETSPSPAPAHFALRRARDEWVKRLVDLSRRNTLLYFRELKSGTLDLTQARERALEDLLNGDKVAARRFFTEQQAQTQAAKLRSISRKAIENFEERGLSTLYLASGLVSWPSDDGGRPPAAPVLLLPVSVEAKGRDPLEVTLCLSGDPKLNEVLRHAVKNNFGAALDPELLGVEPPSPSAGAEAPDDVCLSLKAIRDANERVLAALVDVPGCAVEHRLILGNFSFQKMAMVEDLADLEVLADHQVLGAIAGDLSAKAELAKQGSSPTLDQIDRLPPEAEFLVIDADSSQQAAVCAAVCGKSGVIQGPPGCGKSQTIANAIAALIAEGKRVLFVAEKRAALDVVQRRLASVGLADLCLDLHGGELSKREIARRIGEALERTRTTPPVEDVDLHRHFEERRSALGEHVRLLHSPTPFEGCTLIARRRLELPADDN